MTECYAEVIGDPIHQSKSPAIHGFWLEKAGIAAGYKATLVEASGLETYLADRRADPTWRGCNVTMPHKQAILPLLDRLHPVAKTVGAVNTVTRAQDGALVGWNTDIAGFLEPLDAALAHPHLYRMARILGTGGAARAIVVALSEQGFTIVLAGRNPDKARGLLNELTPEGEPYSPPLSHFAQATDFAFDDREGCCDLIVNASPLGMRGQPPLAFDFSHAPPGSIAYDIVTDPVETAFLADAKTQGLETIDGLSMLIGQAAAAFEKFFGAPAPRDADDELRKRLME